MTNKRLLFSVMGILAFAQCSQSEPGTYLNPDYPVENYNLEVFMDVNYVFNCTVLSRCLHIRLIFYVRDRVQLVLYRLFFFLDAFFDNCMFSSSFLSHR